MRFRNIKTEGGDFAGNKRPALLGRHVRSRLFVPMDNAKMFEQAPLGEKFPNLRTVGDDGEVVDTPLRPQGPEIAEWDLPEPLPAMPDTRPPENHPMDVRVGGTDRPDASSIAATGRYTVTGTTVSRALNVTAPTAANCAQVLNALLSDLRSRGIVNKV
jgi:hypothetical protein